MAPHTLPHDQSMIAVPRGCTAPQDSVVTLVPAVGAGPLRDRLDPKVRRRKRLEEIRQALPSWVTSLITHLLILALLLPTAAPIARNGLGRSQPLSLVVELGDSEANESPVAMRLDGQDEDSDTGQTGNDASDAPHQPAAQAVANDRTAASDSKPPAQASGKQPRATQHGNRRPMTLYERWQRATAAAGSGANNTAYQGLIARAQMSAHSAAIVESQQWVQLADSPQQEHFDQIVDRFILYDVGKLRGPEGQRAVREFTALGPESIPALVRGLNKAAQLHASCPVGVIAGKLMQLLNQQRQPGLFDYAARNLGRDVPEDAPHYRRLSAMRRTWLQSRSSERDGLERVLVDSDITADGPLVELAMALSEGSIDSLLAALESPDVRLQQAALIAILQQYRRFEDDDRGRLYRSVVQLAGPRADARVKKLAGTVLKQLVSRAS